MQKIEKQKPVYTELPQEAKASEGQQIETQWLNNVQAANYIGWTAKRLCANCSRAPNNRHWSPPHYGKGKNRRFDRAELDQWIRRQPCQ